MVLHVWFLQFTPRTGAYHLFLELNMLILYLYIENKWKLSKTLEIGIVFYLGFEF